MTDAKQLTNPDAFLSATIVDRGKFNIAYGDIGAKDAPVIVMCHGLAASGMQFTADAHYFVEQGYRVIVPDVRGHGRSNVPPELNDEEFSIPALASDIIAILDHAEIEEVNYLGNSLGGIVALELMEKHAHRFKNFASFGTSYALKTPRAAVQLLPWFYNLIGTKWIAKLGAKGTTKNKAAQPLVHDMLADCNIDVVTRIVKHVGNYDLISNAVDFTKPILMLRGQYDRSVNAALGSTLKAMEHQENFKLIDVPKGGHCANLDATDQVRRELLKFFGSA